MPGTPPSFHRRHLHLQLVGHLGLVHVVKGEPPMIVVNMQEHLGMIVVGNTQVRVVQVVQHVVSILEHEEVVERCRAVFVEVGSY